MHNNYHFLRLLIPILQQKLAGCVVSECFSQSKDELIIRVETGQKPFFIKASLLPEFSCLSFPDEFNRARKNSADLFGSLIGQRITDIHVFQHERSFCIRFTNNLSLLFKLHGNRSNLILLEQEKPVALFRNNLEADWSIKVKKLHRAIDWSEEAFYQNLNRLEALYFTFGQILWNYLYAHGFNEADTEAKYYRLQQLLRELEQPEYRVIRYEGKIHFSLVPLGEILYSADDPLVALNEFFIRYSSVTGLEKRRHQRITLLTAQLNRAQSYIQKNIQLLEKLRVDDHYRKWGDLIMANLHTIPSGVKHVTLPDFYQENFLVEVKLNTQLSPQKNAEVFYRKARNQHIEIEKLKEGIQAKEKQIGVWTAQLTLLKTNLEPRELKKALEAFPFHRTSKETEENMPYHETEYMGYRIWVGKNAQRNDELTLKFSFKEDLWLHAKDVPGSHVLIKHQAGKQFPKEVIERAAQLAAYYSKRKTDTLCPVIVTPKKFVRKRKGDPPGAVVVEREKVILVEPKPD
jgi:predicted ribosome quality control (RQC) complex YloA/Tae2 family protein